MVMNILFATMNRDFTFNDLVIFYALSFSRNYEMILQFFQARQKPFGPPFPFLDDILHDTYGLLIFQEQLMEISERIGGCTSEESNELRRLMGKLHWDGLTERRPAFVRHAVDNDYTEKQANALYDWLTSHAAYLFKRQFAEDSMTQWLKSEYERRFRS